MTFRHAPFDVKTVSTQLQGCSLVFWEEKEKCAVPQGCVGFAHLFWMDIPVCTHVDDLKKIKYVFASYIVNNGIWCFQLGCLKWNVCINVRPYIAWFLGAQNTCVLPLAPRAGSPAPVTLGDVQETKAAAQLPIILAKCVINLKTEEKKSEVCSLARLSPIEKPVCKRLVRHYSQCSSGNWSEKDNNCVRR